MEPTTHIVINLNITVQNVHIQDSPLTLTAPTIAKQSAKKDKAAMVVSLIKTIEAVAPALPAIVEFFRKAA